jgi:hypothetical protein
LWRFVTTQPLIIAFFIPRYVSVEGRGWCHPELPKKAIQPNR